jgi:hypothetical protein
VQPRLARIPASWTPTVRYLEFADDQAGLVDLRHDEQAGGLELHRRLIAPKNRGGLIAGHVDAERKAADRLRSAIVNAPRFRFASPPAVDRLLRLVGGKFPEARPSGDHRQDHEDRIVCARCGAEIAGLLCRL